MKYCFKLSMLWKILCAFSSLYSTFQLPWSAWAVPPCCVCLPLLWSRTSRPCSSLPWFPWQSCATSSRSISELHPGKGTERCHSGNGNLSCGAELQCSGASCLNLVLSRTKSHLALSESGTDPLQWKCVISQVPLSAALQAELLGGMIRVFVHDQRFLQFTGHNKTNWILSSPRVCPRKCGDRTGKLKSACPGGSGNM